MGYYLVNYVQHLPRRTKLIRIRINLIPEKRNDLIVSSYEGIGLVSGIGRTVPQTYCPVGRECQAVEV